MLYLAEKPELARAIVEALGEGVKRRGYYQCGRDRVAWCFGHMLRLARPEELDPGLKAWRLESLPLRLFPGRKLPEEKSR